MIFGDLEVWRWGCFSGKPLGTTNIMVFKANSSANMVYMMTWTYVEVHSGKLT